MQAEPESAAVETVTCDYCGENIDDIYECKEGLYCQDCYCDHTEACSWCGERHAEGELSNDYVAVFDEKAAGVALPGFYRVQDTPYYRQPLIGPGRLLAWRLQWWGNLPEGLEEPDGYPCGHFCRACQRRMLFDIAQRQRINHDVA